MNFVTSLIPETVNTAAKSGMPGMDGVLEALPYMGYGMVGIFLVTGVIILTVSLLNKLTNKKEK
jgi:Na+/H+ antiporter NhaC